MVALEEAFGHALRLAVLQLGAAQPYPPTLTHAGPGPGLRQALEDLAHGLVVHLGQEDDGAEGWLRGEMRVVNGRHGTAGGRPGGRGERKNARESSGEAKNSIAWSHAVSNMT